MKSCKNTKIVYIHEKSGKVLFSNLIPKDTVRHLDFYMETPAGRVDILLLIMNTCLGF